MAFVQIIEYQSKRFDEITALLDKFRANMDQGTAPSRVMVTKDLDRPNTYVSIVQFDSYETAMQNSQRPETGEMAAAMAELCEGAPKFLNLDVLDEMSSG